MVLAIQVADCLPIFLIAPDVSAIGLVHAGWRGTVASIAREAVRKLKEDFDVDPGSLSCFIGPSIHTCCYTVGREVMDKFQPDHLTENEPNHYNLDLISANSAQLSEAGVAAEKLPLINDVHTVLNPGCIPTADTVTVRDGMSAFST